MVTHDGRLALGPDREPDVGRRDDLLGEAADGLADLLAEHRAAELVQHAEHRAGHRLGLGRQRLAHRGDDALGDRLDQLLPRGHARLDPLGAAPCRRSVLLGRGQVGDAVEPVVGQAGDVLQPSAVAGVGGAVGRLRDHLAGEVAGVVPVDCALVRREHPLQLAEHRLQAGGVAAGEPAEHLLERRAGERVLLVGVVAVVVGSVGGEIRHTSNVTVVG